jgi:hypothetical protein
MARFVPDSTEQAEGREMEDGKWLIEDGERQRAYRKA